METLGEDLVLLALRQNGRMHAPRRLSLALSGAQLVRLTELGRVEILDGRIVVRDQRRTGDALLDAAFVDVCRKGGGRPARTWIARSRPGQRERYLERLAAQGVLRKEKYRRWGLLRAERWQVLDLGRAQQVRARLDQIAESTGGLTPDQVAFAGLVHVAGLDVALYPLTGSGARARIRLRQIARGRPSEIGATPDQDPSAWLLNAVIAATIDASESTAGFSAAQEQSAHHNGHQHDGGFGSGGHHQGHHGGFDSGGHHHGGFDSGGGFSGGHHL